MPKAPSFISTPACSIETAVGAATWPSGDHVWNGQRPASTPQPMTKNGKTDLLEVGVERAIAAGRRASAGRRCRGRPRVKTAKMPMKIRTEPRRASSSASSRRIPLREVGNAAEPQTAISRYSGSTASS